MCAILEYSNIIYVEYSCYYNARHFEILSIFKQNKCLSSNVRFPIYWFYAPVVVFIVVSLPAWVTFIRMENIKNPTLDQRKSRIRWKPINSQLPFPSLQEMNTGFRIYRTIPKLKRAFLWTWQKSPWHRPSVPVRCSPWPSVSWLKPWKGKRASLVEGSCHQLETN